MANFPLPPSYKIDAWLPKVPVLLAQVTALIRLSLLVALVLLKPTTASLVLRTLTRTNRCLENSFLCLTYIVETLDVWRWNKLALATYYDTLYVSRLFDMRDSGRLPTFHSVLSLSVSMILADSVSIRDHTVRISFQSINHSDSFIHIVFFFVRSLDTNLFLSLPLASLLLCGSEYHGSHPFTP